MYDIVLVMPCANRFDKISIRLPVGLLSIAALPDKHGYKIKIIDLKLDAHWQETLKKSIGDNTICAGITCSTGKMILSGLKVAQEVRKISPQLPIVWGGPHPTLVPEQTIDHPLVDIVGINEGDYTFFEIVETLKKGGDLSQVDGIVYKKNGQRVFTKPRELCRNLEDLPMLPYHLVDVSKYSTLTIDNLPSVDILTSRGCPYGCTFCSTPVTSKRLWRAVSVPKIMEHIRFLYDGYGVRTFYFLDDNFMVDLKRVEEFCDAILQSDMKIYWGTQGVTVHTLKKMSKDLLDKIENSGCREFSVGVESANPHILEEIDKKITVEDVLENNKKLVGRKMSVKFNMIIGFPGETMDQVQNTVDLAIQLQKENKNAWFPFNIFTPFPGTKEYYKAVEHGFNPPQRFEDWAHLESVGWGKYFNYWFGPKEIQLLQGINFTSYVAFPAAIQKISNPLLKFLFRFYQPLARFRFERGFYRFHIERYLFQENESINF